MFSRALVPFSAQSYDQLRGSERFAALVRKLGLDVALFTSPTGGRPQALHDIFAELEAALADGIIERYAIGGAVGATFYIEPSATQDVDVFVVFHHTPR